MGHIPLDTAKSPNQRRVEQNQMDEELFERVAALQVVGAHRTLVVLDPGGGNDWQTLPGGLGWFDIANLKFPVQANKTYRWFANLYWWTTNITSGAGFSVRGPGSTQTGQPNQPDLFCYFAQFPNLTAEGSVSTLRLFSGYDTGSVGNNGLSGANICLMWGIIRPTIAGTLALRGMGENATDTMNVIEGSTLEYW